MCVACIGPAEVCVRCRVARSSVGSVVGIRRSSCGSSGNSTGTSTGARTARTKTRLHWYQIDPPPPCQPLSSWSEAEDVSRPPLLQEKNCNLLGFCSKTAESTSCASLLHAWGACVGGRPGGLALLRPRKRLQNACRSWQSASWHVVSYQFAELDLFRGECMLLYPERPSGECFRELLLTGPPAACTS